MATVSVERRVAGTILLVAAGFAFLGMAGLFALALQPCFIICFNGFYVGAAVVLMLVGWACLLAARSTLRGGSARGALRGLALLVPGFALASATLFSSESAAFGALAALMCPACATGAVALLLERRREGDLLGSEDFLKEEDWKTSWRIDALFGDRGR